jgi:hypothetical protein
MEDPLACNLIIIPEKKIQHKINFYYKDTFVHYSDFHLIYSRFGLVYGP